MKGFAMKKIWDRQRILSEGGSKGWYQQILSFRKIGTAKIEGLKKNRGLSGGVGLKGGGIRWKDERLCLKNKGYTKRKDNSVMITSRDGLWPFAIDLTSFNICIFFYPINPRFQ